MKFWILFLFSFLASFSPTLIFPATHAWWVCLVTPDLGEWCTLLFLWEACLSLLSRLQSTGSWSNLDSERNSGGPVIYHRIFLTNFKCILIYVMSVFIFLPFLFFFFLFWVFKILNKISPNSNHWISLLSSYHCCSFRNSTKDNNKLPGFRLGFYSIPT